MISNKPTLESDLSRYNIKNIARYLGVKAARREIHYYESIPEVKVETFSFKGANPITQRMGYKLENISNLFSKKQIYDKQYDSGDLEESRSRQISN
ncbi:hypothetical protein V2A85_24675, partial [Yersinia sp. 1252 StPb PI]|uniref:hypothetical protein n=1 Tax=Yersinia sp. 1252 StPb PI TaxID=3117404 RepID=UPI003B28D68D